MTSNKAKVIKKQKVCNGGKRRKSSKVCVCVCVCVRMRVRKERHLQKAQITK